MAGLVYHAVLAGLWVPRGLDWWADRALHDALPALVLLHWLLLSPRNRLGPCHALAWLLWPAAYAAFVLARGAATGVCPYPFLDLDALGPALLLRNVGLLGIAFLLAGLTLVALSRRPTAPSLALARLRPRAGPGSAPP